MAQKPRRRDSHNDPPASSHAPAPRRESPAPRLQVVVTEGEIDDTGLSLEEMGQALAGLLQAGKSAEGDPHGSKAAIPEEPAPQTFQ